LRIGDQYHCDRVSKSDFEKLAADAGLSKPLVNRRITELAESVIAAMDRVRLDRPIVSALKEQIRMKCQGVREKW